MFRSVKKIVVSGSILSFIMVSIFLVYKNITTQYLYPTRLSTNPTRIPTNPTRIPTNPTGMPTNPTRISTNPTRISTNATRMSKRELLLFVGMHSAPSRLDRRNAIRETWMKECQWNPNAVCRFFTDGQDPKGQALQGEERTKLENECRVYGDILLAEAPGGFNFAIKYLWMLQWANERYNFRYFLRLDDDYFVCFRKLMVELEFFRPKEKFLWGWLHCTDKVATWLDEAFYLVSSDIVESFLSRRDSLFCHVWESQAIGYWIKNISNLTTFADNKRLLHISQEGFSSEKDVVNRKEICYSVLAIHQSYPEKMRMLWRAYEKENKPIAYQVPSISYNCKYPLAMDYMFFRNDKLWFAEPKLCKDNPIWHRSGEYKGRKGS